MQVSIKLTKCVMSLKFNICNKIRLACNNAGRCQVGDSCQNGNDDECQAELVCHNSKCASTFSINKMCYKLENKCMY